MSDYKEGAHIMHCVAQRVAKCPSVIWYTSLLLVSSFHSWLHNLNNYYVDNFTWYLANVLTRW